MLYQTQKQSRMEKIIATQPDYNKPYPQVRITLKDLCFHAYHGVLKQENEIGGDYKLTLTLSIDQQDAHDALFANNLEGTINYAEVFAIVAAEMQQPSQLLEHLCARICRRLIRSYNKLQEATVEVTKCCPPIQGFQGKGISVSFSLKRQLVAWDFDGTIADTRRGIVRTMTETFRQLGYPIPTPEAICQTIGLPLIVSIAQLARIEGDKLNTAITLYKDIFEQVGNEGVTLFPTVLDKMRRQHEQGKFVAIATSRGHESVSNFCKQLGLSPYVDYIVAAEDVMVHKPNPAPIHLLCQMANVHPDQTTVIGDTTFDILMGRNAHVKQTIGVSWGNHSCQQLIKAGATYVVDAF